MIFNSQENPVLLNDESANYTNGSRVVGFRLGFLDIDFSKEITSPFSDAYTPLLQQPCCFHCLKDTIKSNTGGNKW